MSDLIFNQSPTFELATNFFTRVPIVLRYKGETLIEMVSEVNSHGMKIPIFHSDGTRLAVVNKSRLFPTVDGEKAGVTIEHHPNLEVCKLGDKTLYELRRDAPAALSISAELYAPHGVFIKADKSILEHLSGGGMQVCGMFFRNNHISDCGIGIDVQ